MQACHHLGFTLCPLASKCPCGAPLPCCRHTELTRLFLAPGPQGLHSRIRHHRAPQPATCWPLPSRLTSKAWSKAPPLGSLPSSSPRSHLSPETHSMSHRTSCAMSKEPCLCFKSVLRSKTVRSLPAGCHVPTAASHTLAGASLRWPQVRVCSAPADRSLDNLTSCPVDPGTVRRQRCPAPGHTCLEAARGAAGRVSTRTPNQ